MNLCGFPLELYEDKPAKQALLTCICVTEEGTGGVDKVVTVCTGFMPFSIGIGIQCEVPSLAVADCTKRLYRTFEILDRNHRSIHGKMGYLNP